MQKIALLALAIPMLLFSAGCGSGLATDSSKATPPMAPDDHTKDIEEAMKSGKIDPNTYGKQ